MCFVSARMISNDVAKERMEFAIGTSNGFTQDFKNGDLEDVDTADRFLLKNNLTIATAMHEIGLLIFLRKMFKTRYNFNSTPIEMSTFGTGHSSRIWFSQHLILNN